MHFELPNIGKRRIHLKKKKNLNNLQILEKLLSEVKLIQKDGN